MSLTHPHIVIVGAGIVGASLAYHLTCQKARVTLIEKAPEPANDATGKSFAWLAGGRDESECYFRLRQEAIADWHRVDDELKGKFEIDWSGALFWFQKEEETERMSHRFTGSGHSVHLVDQQEIRLLEPNLKKVPHLALFAKNEGALGPVIASKLFFKAAREGGAGIEMENEVLSLVTNGTRVTGVVTARGNVKADLVVLATGRATSILCGALGIRLPVAVSPAILMNFYNPSRFVNHIVSNPYMEIRAASNTVTLAAENYIDESTANNPEAIAQHTLEEIMTQWQGVEQIKLKSVLIGKRAIPKDSLPVIGRATGIDGLYLSVMHSGVTLAALAGRLAAAEILSGQDDQLLSPFRVGRLN